MKNYVYVEPPEYIPEELRKEYRFGEYAETPEELRRKLDKAIVFATNAHAGSVRKGKTRPYILHPLEAMIITSTVTEDVDVLAAAVLHDTVEDTDVTRNDILREFDEKVADLVVAESENKRENLPAEDTWKIRKQETLDHLEEASWDAKAICLGDKLSNMREIYRDYLFIRDEIWDRFNQKDKSMHAWYYNSILKILEKTFGPIPAIKEYRSIFAEVFG